MNNDTQVEVTITTVDGNDYLQIDAEAAVVQATPCLPWTFTDGSAKLATYKAFEYFLAGHDVARNDTTTLEVNVLQIRGANAATFRTIINEYTEVGVFNATHHYGEDLESAVIAAYPMLGEDAKCLHAEDMLLHDTEATTTARGRRQREAPTAEEITEEPSIHFLSVTKVKDLLDEGERPLRHLCRLLGLLGSSTMARRSEVSSSLRVMASLLKHYIMTYLKLPGPAGPEHDSILASSIRSFMAATEPGYILKSGRTDDHSTRNEAIDGIRRERPHTTKHSVDE